MNSSRCLCYLGKEENINKLIWKSHVFSSFKIIIILAVSLLLEACATSQFSPGASKNFSNVKDAPLITVMRESTGAASGLNFPLELDGKKIASVGSGSAFTFPVTPGKHFINLSWGDDDFLKSVEAKHSKHYYFIFRIDVFGEKGPAYIEQMTFENGKKEFNSGSYDKFYSK